MKYLFVTGMGRSGTQFLAHLLEHVSNVKVCHEGIGNREFWLMSWYLGEAYAIPYLEQVRAQIEADHATQNISYFIDVNGYLQHAVPALRTVFQEASIVHLVRDPRKVIPSIYLRRNEQSIDLLPKDPEDLKWWIKASKFEQICWNWMHTTQTLLQQDTILLNFEKVLQDFDYFHERVLRPHRLSLNKSHWMSAKSQKKNQTRSQLFRYLYAKLKGKAFVPNQPIPYEEWTPIQMEQFSSICGPIAQQVNYPI